MSIGRETKRVGERIAAFRKAKGWSYTDMTQATGMDRSNLWRIEHGRYSPTVDTLELMAKALGLKPSELTSEDDPAIICHRHERRTRLRA